MNEARYQILNQTSRININCITVTYNWPIKLNASCNMQHIVTDWNITVKVVLSGDNLILELEGSAVNLNVKLAPSFCKIDILNNVDEIVFSYKDNVDGPLYDKFNFKNLVNLTDLRKKTPNLEHVVAGRTNIIVLALTIGVRKEKKKCSFKPQKRMLDDNILTDTVIKTKSKDFPCHKFVLATHSEYFKVMFEANMKECDKNIVDWIDVFDSETVQDLLHFLYTGQTPPNIRGTFPTLVEAAHLCLLDQLKDVCFETMLNIINVDNAGSILEIAEKFDLESLREKAILFILENNTQVLDTLGFQRIDDVIKIRLLKRVFQILGKTKGPIIK